MEIKFEGITVLCGLTNPINDIIIKLEKENKIKQQYTQMCKFIECEKHPLDYINDIKNIIKDFKSGCYDKKLLIITHSTYTLEAIDVYSQYYEVDKHCNYYLATDEEIIDCKDNLEKIYELFADAFDELDLIKFRL